MISEEKHNPVTNGKTKLMVLLSIIFIFVITLVSLSFAFAATFGLVGLALFLAKGLFGTIAVTGLGALVAVTTKFFDTRTSEIKSRDKLELKKENHKYKIEKRALRQNKK